MAETFGKYRLLKPIAQGGMAEIFLAKHEGPAGFSKTVVIKRVLPHFSNNPDFVQMFLDEARLAACLSHPNIIHIDDFGQADGVYFLCMEHLAGEDLSALIRLSLKRGHPFHATIAALVIAAACDGLHYAHTLPDESGKPLRIVHRDISPSNIFVTYQGAVKVLDFGIAKAEGKVVQTRSGHVKGKLQYMSPEQVGSRSIDARTDVFALGAVLYELVTGIRLFQRDEDAGTIMAIVHDPIVPPSQRQPDVPPDLDDVILRALERDAGKRYQSADEMRKALEDFLSSRTSAPIASQLKEFMLHLVGEERIKQRSAVTGSHQPKAITGSNPAAAPPRASTAATKAWARPSAELVDHRAPPVSRGGKQKTVLLAVSILVLLAGGALAVRRPWETAGAESSPPVAIVAKAPPASTLPPAPAEVLANLGRVEVDLPVADAGPALQPPEIETPPEAVRASDPEVLAAVDPDAPKKKGSASKRSPASRQGGKSGTASAARSSASTGFLDINCVPWCRVYVDDSEGVDSPVQGLKLSAGEHRVRVVNPPSGMTRKREITIKANETAEELIRF